MVVLSSDDEVEIPPVRVPAQVPYGSASGYKTGPKDEPDDAPMWPERGPDDTGLYLFCVTPFIVFWKTRSYYMFLYFIALLELGWKKKNNMRN